MNLRDLNKRNTEAVFVVFNMTYNLFYKILGYESVSYALAMTLMFTVSYGILIPLGFVLVVAGYNILAVMVAIAIITFAGYLENATDIFFVNKNKNKDD